MEKNFILPDTSASYPYQWAKGGGENKKWPQRDRLAHAKKIEHDLEAASEAREVVERRGGEYLQFNSSPGYGIDPDKFENLTSKIHLLGVKRSGDADSSVVSATVYVPSHKADFFLNRVLDYADDDKNTKKGNWKNKELVESIDSVTQVSPRTLWSDDASAFPGDLPIWCEIWIDTTQSDAERVNDGFTESCKNNDIEYSEKHIVFPEHIVVLAKVNAKQLDCLFNDIGRMSEIRRLAEPNSDLLGFDGRSQREFADDLQNRVQGTQNPDISVCLLDSGMNASHPLLIPAINGQNSILSAEPGWPTNDDEGHGTEMAGVALYEDLKEQLISFNTVSLHSSIESVRIFPQKGSNAKELYGLVTSDAMAAIETEHPGRNRIYCMAVTDKDSPCDGRPSSWSAMLDGLIADAASEGTGRQRLCMVSAGNLMNNDASISPYTDANVLAPVEDPAQSWNAVSVGAYTDYVTVEHEGYDGYHAVAPKGGLSPYSRTSATWEGDWPIKPEICCEGGNRITNGYNLLDPWDLGKLTTSNDIPNHYFDEIRATSAATAQAAWMAAQILEAYPTIWPETVRGLLVHSARWTDEMKKAFLGASDKSKTARRALLRSCGWGVPHLDYALGCLDSRINLIVQGEIQPFDNHGKTNEMKLHELPWPSEELLKLGEVDTELRVTLSYFVEPNPGDRGWKSKFRYASCGLRFQAIGPNQSKEDLLKSISKKMREDDNDTGGSSGSKDWYLGLQNRDRGSIHSDFKQMTAADLSSSRYIVVYPVYGWWAKRKALGKMTNRIRYSLIVTIETLEVESQLYNEVATQVKVPIPMAISA